MDGHGELGLSGEGIEPGLLGRMREDINGVDSRSGSDNFEPGSGDDQEPADNRATGKRKRTRYHRHNASQIQELESFFKECPHPDDRQRSELGMRLGLEGKQIKFWFQNRRTQMKTQLERHENVILRQENDKLRVENDMLRQAMAAAVCYSCGGQAVPGDISFDHHQIRIENARLRDELNRMSSLTSKFISGPGSSSSSPVPSQCLNSNLELAVGRNGYGGSTLPLGFDFGAVSRMSAVKPMAHDKSAILDVALLAMDELMKMASVDNPLWIKGLDDGMHSLNIEEYRRTFNRCIGMTPIGFATEATKATGIVYLRGLALVEAMMDPNRWVEMFPCMISRAAIVDVISKGTSVAGSNELQVMDAEFQMLTPFVPIRQVRFVRFCKKHSEGVWAVVDVSIDVNQGSSNAHMFPNCRRLPSGFVIQDVDNNYSKITWVEHSEYDDSGVHGSLRRLLSSGFGFGAHKWVATLQRQCDSMAMLVSQDVPVENDAGLSFDGKKSMIKLAQRMVRNFCAGVSASSIYKWEKCSLCNFGEDVRVLTRTSMYDPGEPRGVVVSATISTWMPVTQQRLFDFLRAERMRGGWDVLSHGSPMTEMVHIAKGFGHDNCVSLLRGTTAFNPNDSSGMLIFQETFSDVTGALVVYSPVDVSSMSRVMNGSDPGYVALLPSGFSILPGLPPSHHRGQSDSNEPPMAKPEGDGSITGGCLLTVGFQILVNNVPTEIISKESAETVSHLVAHTMQKIKSAVTP